MENTVLRSARNFFAFWRDPIEQTRRHLETLEKQTTRTGGGIRETSQSTERALKDLGAQSHRTGAAIVAGADAGAASLGGLAAAGLAAYEALKLVQETMHKVISDAAKAESFTRAARETGVPTQWLRMLRLILTKPR